VALETGDGERIHGWFVPAQSERAVLLFFHGNAGNISHRLDSLRIFHALGLSVLMIDYRGYGASTGRPSEQGTYEDALAAWRHLVEARGVEPGRIILFGRSMGGAVATWLATQHPPGALIVESTFRSVPDLAAAIYWFFPVRLLARIEYPVERLLGVVSAPVLIVHSHDDEIIPFSHGEALQAAAGPGTELLVLRGDHNTGFLQDEARYRAGLHAFFSGIALPGRQ
jgi:pimeloyl-ACP methyl ester carboxylesterase